VMSGKNPLWKKKNDAVRIAAVCQDETPQPRDHRLLPETDILWDLLKDCWIPEPEARPSINAVLQTLEGEKTRRRAIENSLNSES
ncbi:hypothetical protein FRC00_006430, partial [Tulasnella sp. 408]